MPSSTPITPVLPLGIIIYFLCIMIGCTVVYFISKILVRVGGQVGQAFKFILLGVVLQIVALVFDLINLQANFFPNLQFIESGDIRNIIIIGSFLSFLVASKKIKDLY